MEGNNQQDDNKLADIFGKPEEGVHAATIPVLNLAAVDVIGTIGIAAGISWYWKKPFVPTLIGTFIIGELSHLAFGVETRFIKMMRRQ
jgi:hypothetical protein